MYVDLNHKIHLWIYAGYSHQDNFILLSQVKNVKPIL